MPARTPTKAQSGGPGPAMPGQPGVVSRTIRPRRDRLGLPDRRSDSGRRYMRPSVRRCVERDQPRGRAGPFHRPIPFRHFVGSFSAVAISGPQARPGHVGRVRPRGQRLVTVGWEPPDVFGYLGLRSRVGELKSTAGRSGGDRRVARRVDRPGVVALAARVGPTSLWPHRRCRGSTGRTGLLRGCQRRAVGPW